MPRHGYHDLLKRKGFSAFLGTQFLGALNDNLLKWVITFLAMAGLVRGASGNLSHDQQSIGLYFIFPALLFSGLAGYLADNFEKRRILVATKAWEIMVMGLAWWALQRGDFQAQLGVLFLLATQFTFFGPAKYGVVPELVEAQDLSRANGLLEMSTFLAIVLGSLLAGPLFDAFKDRLDELGWVLLGVAALGSGLSLGIPPTPRPLARAPFGWSLFWSEVAAGTRLMRSERRLWVANLGVAYFWFQGALMQLAVVPLGHDVLHLSERGVTGLFMALALGIGAGSLLAGRLSGDKVELGLVPLGSLGMGAGAVAAALASRTHPAVVPWALAGVGLSAGLFVVPLNTVLQQQAGDHARGRVQAANNFFVTLGIIAAALVLGQSDGRLGLGIDTVLLLAGLGCFLMTAYLGLLLPEFLTRACLWLATHSLQRIRPQGAAGLPTQGPLLLLCRAERPALSLLLQACLQRSLFIFAPPGVAIGPRWLAKAIPLRVQGSGTGWRDAAREALREGHGVCFIVDGGHPGVGRGLPPGLKGLAGKAIPIFFVDLAVPARRPWRIPSPIVATFSGPSQPS